MFLILQIMVLNRIFLAGGEEEISRLILLFCDWDLRNLNNTILSAPNLRLNSPAFLIGLWLAIVSFSLEVL